MEGVMKHPKIKVLKALDNYILQATFADNNITKKYDCKPLIKKEPFILLKSLPLFKTAKIDAGGYGISWNDDIDLDAYEIWIAGVEETSSDSLSGQ